MRIKESFIKYYCGVFDADGCCSFNFSKTGYIRLFLKIRAVNSIDRNFKMLKYFEKEFCGLGKFNIDGKTSIDNLSGTFGFTKRSDINMIVPRMLKHLVIKGKHCKRMFLIWRSLRGKQLTDVQIDRLKKFSKWSRQHNGPVKPKKHPTWAWLAGYIDGDGCLKYKLRTDVQAKSPSISLSISAHEKDRQGIDLIQKAFKGYIHPEGRMPWILVYTRNLGVSDSSFTKKFLPKLLRYCKVKHYRIEQILAFHNKYHNDRRSTNRD